MFKNKTPQKETMFALYEELYDSANEINREAIHKAMITLMKHFDLEEFMDKLDPDMLCVVHEERVRDEQKRLERIESSIREILDNA